MKTSGVAKGMNPLCAGYHLGPLDVSDLHGCN